VPGANNLEPLLNKRLRQLSVSFLSLPEGSEGEQNLIQIFIFALLLFFQSEKYAKILKDRALYCNIM